HGTNPGRDATLVGSLRTAIATLTTQQGTADPTQWLTNKITVQFDETSASPFLYGPTIIEREDRGTMNEGSELTPTPSSEVIARTPTLSSESTVPPGERGFIPGPPAPVQPPPPLRDQVPVYESFQYHSLPFTQAELEAPTTTQTITVP